MGFGTMFFGFLFLAKAVYAGVDFLPDFAGYCLLLTGMKTAGKHCDCFDFSWFAGIGGLILSAVKFAAELYYAVGGGTMSVGFDRIFGGFYEIYTVFFAVSLMISLFRIEKQTELPKLCRRSVTNAVLTGLFGISSTALLIASSLFTETGREVSGFLGNSAIPAALSLLWVILDAANLFSCYMWICLEGDEEMEDNKNRKYKTPFDIVEQGNRKRAENGGKGSKKR
ncbi:MAG: hypothetical protein KBS76_03915 [Ruminococcus sp.]|nr:hypothetical protein [Candidatus Apopatosoma intestinale]